MRQILSAEAQCGEVAQAATGGVVTSEVQRYVLAVVAPPCGTASAAGQALHAVRSAVHAQKAVVHGVVARHAVSRRGVYEFRAIQAAIAVVEIGYRPRHAEHRHIGQVYHVVAVAADIVAAVEQRIYADVDGSAEGYPEDAVERAPCMGTPCRRRRGGAPVGAWRWHVGTVRTPVMHMVVGVMGRLRAVVRHRRCPVSMVVVSVSGSVGPLRRAVVSMSGSVGPLCRAVVSVSGSVGPLCRAVVSVSGSVGPLRRAVVSVSGSVGPLCRAVVSVSGSGLMLFGRGVLFASACVGAWRA